MEFAGSALRDDGLRAQLIGIGIRGWEHGEMRLAPLEDPRCANAAATRGAACPAAATRGIRFGDVRRRARSDFMGPPWASVISWG